MSYFSLQPKVFKQFNTRQTWPTHTTLPKDLQAIKDKLLSQPQLKGDKK